ncbi:MAG: amino acid ABC transporter substrate-binding protein [Proteobacteria bacterium]|nr:amino acid ABC transporter substrate-binding protein [Pseudomonadota bacterium]
MKHAAPARRSFPLAGAALACLAALSAAGPAQAESGDVLKKIKDSGEITLGYREASIPFSYLGGDAQPIGYSIDLCNRVVDAVKKELKLPNLKVNLQAVTSQNRIPLVQNGTVTLECGSTVNNAERQPLVGFSVTTFVVATRFVGRKAAHQKTVDDLKGRTVAVTTGTNTVKRVRELNEARKLGMTLVNGKDHAESMLLVTSGRADAFFEDDILLTGMAASSQTPGDFALSTEGYSVDPYALMFAKGDPEFKRLVDGTLKGLFASGDINRIYDKWFTRPIPPKNIVLNFPMGATLKQVIAKPTDSPDAADYK